MSAGFDHVDTKALARRGVKLGSSTFFFPVLLFRPSTDQGSRAAPDALTDATADVGAMLVLMASRRAGEVSFPSSFYPSRPLNGTLMLLVCRAFVLSLTASGLICPGTLCCFVDKL